MDTSGLKVGDRVEWFDFTGIWQPGVTSRSRHNGCWDVLLDGGRTVGIASPDRLRPMTGLKFDDLKLGMKIETLAYTGGKWQLSMIDSISRTERADGKSLRAARAHWLNYPNRRSIIRDEDLAAGRVRMPQPADDASAVMLKGTLVHTQVELEQVRAALDEAKLAKDKAEKACQRLAEERDAALGRAEAAEEDVEKRDAQLAEVAASMADANHELRRRSLTADQMQKLRDLRQDANQCASSHNYTTWCREIRDTLDEILRRAEGHK